MGDVIYLRAMKTSKDEEKSFVPGDIVFCWSDVQHIECSRRMQAIVHFKNGHVFKSNKSFKETRALFLKYRNAKKL